MNDPNPTGPYQPATVDEHVAGTPQYIGRYRIERILGKGGFGLVYLAHVEQLQRLVAIKVPHRPLVSAPGDTQAYLSEARTVANLDHPHIVPVYDVGSTERFPCFVVSKYIDGTDLAARLKQSRLALNEAIELVATVAEALHHAHKQGLVHRDIKPGNILLDRSSKPFVADFGLALREQDIGKEPGYAGTPAHMSPEQARGEGHRVDGRSDIFSLGVVLYELLVGRRPFKAESLDELLDQIASLEPRPPRQIDDAIPKELDRICLKALSKRTSERYSAARDMAEDLRHFLGTASVEEKATLAGRGKHEADVATPVPSPTTPPGSDTQPVRIVPKGLRSFDETDADFFLELLPGARDRDGLPDSIRFWKTRIEIADADRTFSVGLIYGPSGCGKSSLVKAGLLPRLAKSVIVVYIEATGEETEARLLKGLRRQLPDLPSNLGLIESLAALRRGRHLEPGQKLLLMLDQFEQWLHAKRNEENTELVQALRQCDGGRLQAIVMVRDDFGMAATRFMAALDIPILQGNNFATVDLFDPLHARKVLAAFGRAYGRLPDNLGQCSKDQNAFLDQAVAGLAEDGKIISVRLALFAEMVKGKPWTPSTLKEVGGTEGVGVTFLEETFTASTAPPQHRLHQKAAQAVLKALLPETGTAIKGSMRSQQELLEAAGYANRPKDFDDLILILDGVIRLITPTDLEGKEDADSSTVQPGAKYYQLTHDYLVHSLRDWLTRKQKETRKGRAELLLADRAVVWNARTDYRQLPSLIQWLQIRWHTSKKNWTPPQRKMMGKAERHHALRAGIVAVVLALATFTGLTIWDRVKEKQKANHAAGLVQAVLNADIAQVPAIVGQMTDYRQWADPLLRDENSKAADKSRQKLQTSLALLPVDASQVNYLKARLLDAEPGEVAVIRDALFPHKDQLVGELWLVVEAPQKDKESQRLRAAAALAKFDAESEKWAMAQEAVGNDLVVVPAVYLSVWMDALRPMRAKLRPQLTVIYRNRAIRETERSLATDILADYAADDPPFLADLLMDADDKQFAALFLKLHSHQEEGQAALLAELDRKLQPRWADLPLDPAWKPADGTLVQKIEAAHGLVHERFAFCQMMPLAEFLTVAEQLRSSGYRPTRFRPYATANGVQVAAVWTRDGRTWQMAFGLSKEQMARHDEALQRKGYLPEDVAGYGRKGLHFGAIWVAGNANGAVRWQSLGVPEPAHQASFDRMVGQGFTPLTVQVTAAQDGTLILSQVYGKAGVEGWEQRLGIDESGVSRLAALGLLADVSLGTREGGRLIYGGISYASKAYTSAAIFGNTDAEHNARSKDLLARGYRPASLAVRCFGPNQAKVVASVWHRPVVGEDDKERLAKRQANAAVALLKLNQSEKVWPLLKHSPDPRVRTYLIHRLIPLGADANALVKRLDEETTDLTIRRALLLSLGEYGEKEFAVGDRKAVLPKLQDIYRTAADPGLHGAAEWLLRKWKQEPWLKQVNEEWAQDKKQREQRLEGIKQMLAKEKDKTAQQWYVNGQGQTMVVIPGPVEFLMGSPAAEEGRSPLESQHKRRIGRSFAIAAKPVTVREFRRFLWENKLEKWFEAGGQAAPFMKRYSPEENGPIIIVDWFHAAAYCNWLSEQEGIPSEQWCYETNAQRLSQEKVSVAVMMLLQGHPLIAAASSSCFLVDRQAQVTTLRKNYLSLAGYRLPTEAEWEYACRAGAVTSRYYGEAEELLAKYAWYQKNSQERTWPGGRLKPNDLGLFDMQGNVFAWCQERYWSYPQNQGNEPLEDKEDLFSINMSDSRACCGGSFDYLASNVRSSFRRSFGPADRNDGNGIRAARTYR